MRFHDEWERVDLGGEWSFAYTWEDRAARSVESLGGDGVTAYPCRVPGNLELDLQANGLIDDPFYAMNIVGLTKYEKAHVWYARAFEAEDRPGFDSELVFEGLDCFGDIYLNGELIGSCDNMLIEHSFDVTGRLRGENEIVVHIRPAVEEARKYDYPPSLGTLGSNMESLHIRKAPHMYGWDIMPRAVSAGIWRPVYVQYKPKERLDRVCLRTEWISGDRKAANLSLSYSTHTGAHPDGPYEIAVEGTCGESTFTSRQRVLFDAGSAHIYVANPMLWWPRGRGEANLYEVVVTLLKDGEAIDRAEFTHGIRTVELDRTSLTDARGNGEFCFKVNGERVFVLGTNWVPADVYHSRDAERIPKILEMVDDIGCNAVRCWGGNVYETDDFYGFCDRKGIMVWQDFGMACGAYPQDAEFQRRLEIEARSVVRRLRQHPSIILWTGDNECDMMLNGWGRDPNDNVLTRVVLPSVLREEDSSRPYLPSSPYIDDTAFNAGGAGTSEDHLWGPRDYYKGDFYKSPIAHFASEIGYHGCPSPESIRKFISPEKVWPYKDNEEWILHSTSPVPGVNLYDYRVELMASQVRELFGQVPDNLEDFAYASQVSQSEAKKYFIELFRSTKWRRTGIIWWNLMDGWPELSDAVVDYYFCKKLAYHTIKRSQAPVLLTLREPANWRQELVACNDTREDLRLEYRVADVESGEVMAEGCADAPADSATAISSIRFQSSWHRLYTLDWWSGDQSGRSHYLAGNPPFDLATVRRWLRKAYDES